MVRKLQPLDLTKDLALERIEERAAPTRMRWTLVLTWCMRLLAVLWIMKGLSSWAAIVGLAPGAPFESRLLGYQATIIYFAVIDLVAAVGLWMASTWGGVLWLLAVMSHLVLAFVFPHIIPAGTTTFSIFGVMVVLYLLLSWLSAREVE